MVESPICEILLVESPIGVSTNINLKYQISDPRAIPKSPCLDFLPVETPIRLSTKFMLVETPIGLSTMTYTSMT